MKIKLDNQKQFCDTKDDWGYPTDQDFAADLYLQKNLLRNENDILRKIIETLIQLFAQKADAAETKFLAQIEEYLRLPKIKTKRIGSCNYAVLEDGSSTSHKRQQLMEKLG